MRFPVVVAIALLWGAGPRGAHAQPPGQVGVAAAVRGQVLLARAGDAAQPVRSGTAILLNDQVTTRADGQLQILLLDETVFTIGPNSAITIDTFVYDPATDAGTVSAAIAKGVFRFVSGRIAHKDPKQMKVKLPSGTIGVRGTVVSGVVEGTQATVALIGRGSITVDNAAQQVEVSRPGFGTIIGGPEAPPTLPTFVGPEQMAVMAQALGPLVPGVTGPPGTTPGTLSEAPSQTPSQAPGQPQAAGETPGSQPGPGGPAPGPGMLGPPGPMPMGPMMPGAWGQFGPPEIFAQQFAPPPGGFFGPGPYGFGPPPPGAAPIPGFFDPNLAAQQAAQQMIQVQAGMAKLEDLRLIQNGVGHFHKSLANGFTQTAPVNVTGQLEVFFDINFGARTVGGGNSRLKVDTGVGPLRIQQTMTLGAQSFATGTGNAVFTASSGALSGTLTLNNGTNVVANSLKVEATFDNGVKTGSGVIEETPQIAGSLSPAP